MAEDLVLRIGNSTRVEESQIRSYKWASDKDDHEAFLYANIINFKRSSNPRGHAHHCVMCGDRKAAIPSQNKDVCKTCDSGYWLVESVQVVVKFCKGCKNFTRLHDFRDKPEATKCIKCRQRGRQNYFAKKGRGDLASLPPPSKALEGDSDHILVHGHGGGNARANASSAQSYDYYMDDQVGMGPRVTSSRQVALQKNRMNKNKSMGQSHLKPRSRGPVYNTSQSHYIIDNPGEMMPMPVRPHDHARGESFSSLLNGSYMPDDQNLLPLGDDDDGMTSRSRSDTLLSISSIGLAGLGESLGISTGKGKRVAGRTRVGSDDWDVQPTGQFGLLTSDVFDNDVPTFVDGKSNGKGKGVDGNDDKGDHEETEEADAESTAAEASRIASKFAGKGKFMDESEVGQRHTRGSSVTDMKRERSSSNVSEQSAVPKRSRRNSTDQT